MVFCLVLNTPIQQTGTFRSTVFLPEWDGLVSALALLVHGPVPRSMRTEKSRSRNGDVVHTEGEEHSISAKEN